MGSDPTPTFHESLGVMKGSAEIGNFALYLSKRGYREGTIWAAVRALKAVAKRVNLLDPERMEYRPGL